MANSIVDFQDLLADSFARFLQLSNDVSPIVKEQSDYVKQALTAQLQFIVLASRSQKPNDSQFVNLLKPTSDLIAKIQVFYCSILI